MANLAGKLALVVDVDDSALADGIAAGLVESAASVDRGPAATLPRRLAQAASGQAAPDVLVGDLVPLLALGSALAGLGRGLVVALADAGSPGVDTLGAELDRAGVTLLALHPATPGVTGRCIAALAMDPDIAEKSGGSFRVAELAREYRFSDPDAG
ncbi:MAG: hypothetical protein RIC56_12545 [Pseudomonadales bacterium]